MTIGREKHKSCDQTNCKFVYKFPLAPCSLLHKSILILPCSKIERPSNNVSSSGPHPPIEVNDTHVALFPNFSKSMIVVVCPIDLYTSDTFERAKLRSRNQHVLLLGSCSKGMQIVFLPRLDYDTNFVLQFRSGHQQYTSIALFCQ
jgi:hypothetical protein